MFTMRNAIKVALMQVGVIVAGILAASVGYHAASGRVGFAPASTAFLVQFGFLLLALPLGWITAVVRLRNSEAVSRRQHALAFGSGIALIIGLTLFSAYAVGKPWIGSTEWLQTG
jgi:hypothetical protein